MKKLLLTLILFQLLINLGSSQNWTLQQAGTNINFTSCFFTNISTGYVVGDGMMFRTTNGGINWFQQTLPIIGGDDEYVYFIDATTGFMTGGFRIIKSIDGGNTWTENYFATIYYVLFGISFFNSNTGCAVGEDLGYDMRTLRTVDGGGSWTFINNSAGDWRITAICTIPNTGTGYFVTTGGSIKKTVNYGLNWTYVYTRGGTLFRSVHFENLNTGYAVGNYSNSPFYNIFVKTTNGGTNWDSSGCGGYLARYLFFTSDNTGYISCDSGKILTTTNSGLNWNTQTITNKNINSMFFPSAQTGYAVGDSGLILKTINGGGLTSITNNRNMLPEEYLLCQNYPNPFNSSTTIKYQVPAKSHVTLKVFDLLGKEITTLVNEELEPGYYEAMFDAINLSSGIYFYRLESGKFSSTKKLVLIK